MTHLRTHGVLATGLNYPVVPSGDEEIRFQVSADHTEADIDEALEVLRGLPLTSRRRPKSWKPRAARKERRRKPDSGSPNGG